MDFQTKRGVSPSTWNDILLLLRTIFRRANSHIFDEFITKEKETIYRTPYSPEELKLIIDAASSDPFIRPIIVTAICTAMRLGDICQLRFSSLDLTDGFISVKTSKTRITVDVPIAGIET